MSEADLIERPAVAVAKHMQPVVPPSIRLWSTEAIATYLQRPTQVVRERVVCMPGFPRPIRLPAVSGGKAIAHPDGKQARSSPGSSRTGTKSQIVVAVVSSRLKVAAHKSAPK